MRTFYLGKPNTSGVFVIDLKRDQFVDDGVSLYKFEPIKDDEKKAYFSLYNAPGVYKEISDLKGAENWKSFVLPVCDCDSYPEKLIDSVETITKGEAELRPSGNWKVVKKAKVTYTESDTPEWYKAIKTASPPPTSPTRRLKKEIKPLEEGSVDTTTEPDNKTQPLVSPPPPSRSIETFFFSSPIGNTFNVSKKTEKFIESESLYRFERVAGENSAQVFIVENIPRAVQQFTSGHISQMDVCEIVGSYNKDAVRVETVKPGRAVLEDGKWTIKKKVKISYVPQPKIIITNPPPDKGKDRPKESSDSDSVTKKSNPLPKVLVILALCAIAIYYIARPSADAIFNKGKEQFEAKNFTEAVTYFSKAIKRKSDNPEIHGWRGKAYFELKNYESAATDFKEAARLAPKAPEYPSKLGEVYFAVKNYDGAVTAYTNAIRLDPNNAEYYFSRGMLYGEKKAYSTAIEDYTQAIRLNPKDARFWNSRGGDYRNMGDNDKAYTDHSEAIRLNPSEAKYYNNRGVAQLLRKKYAEAISDYSEAIRLDSNNARYYNNRGEAYRLNKDIKKAGDDFCMAYKLESTNEVYKKNCEITRPSGSEDPRDGQKYSAVNIGGKIWLAQNMNYQPQTGNSWCYDNNSSNCGKYGRLYDWTAAKAACMSGWHLPSRKEWKDLIATVGASAAGKKLKVGPPEWNGTDEHDFSARPSGYRNDDGSFSAIGTDGGWWTATEINSSSAYLIYMGYDYGNVLEVDYEKSNGISVRCVKDAQSAR